MQARHAARAWKALSPTGALGHTPIEEPSYARGLARAPDMVGADAGSGDIGPRFLGADIPYCAREWQEHDLDLLLTTTRREGIPLLVGSADGCGSDRAVAEMAQMVRDVAARRRLPAFRMAVIRSEVQLEFLAARLDRGQPIVPLGAPAPLTPDDLHATSHAVAMMGAEPYLEALRQGAEVVIAGRSCDDAIFAAPAIRAGCDRGLAWHLGKVLECASMAATPLMLHESMLGTIADDEAIVEPMHPDQRCTPESLASHSLYERSDPCRQDVPGGTLDMSETRFRAVDGRRAAIAGSRFRPAGRYRVKIEGAGPAGHRHFGIVGIRDPAMIARLDEVTDAVVAFVHEKYPDRARYRLHFHVYGRDAVMGGREPFRRRQSPGGVAPPSGQTAPPAGLTAPHEVGVVIEGVADTRELSRVVTNLAQFRFFAARFPGQKQTAGGAALLQDDVLDAGPACRWTIDHLLTLDDPLELFPMTIETVGGAGRR